MKNRSILILLIIIASTTLLLVLGSVATAIQQQQTSTPPIIDLNGLAQPGINYSATYTENMGLIPIVDSTTLTVTDTDDLYLTSATVTLLSRPDGKAEWIEVETAGSSLKSNYNQQTGKLTLIPNGGTEPLASFQDVLRTIRYINESDDPDKTQRIVQFVISDGQSDSQPAETAVSVHPINDAPILNNEADLSLGQLTEDALTNDGHTVATLLNQTGVPLVTDPDGPFTGIALVGANNTNGNWQYKSGGLWLNVGAVTEQTAVLLDSSTRLRFAPNNNFFGETGIRFRAWDQSSGHANGSNSVNTIPNGGATPFSSAIANANLVIVPENDAPVIDLNGIEPGTKFQAVFVEDGGAIAIVSETALTVTDADTPLLEFAQVTLTARPDGVTETLATNVTLPEIAVSYEPTTGKLQLEGPATPSQFQQVLRSVVYNNLSQHPNNSDRTIEFIVNDGISNSLKAISTVAINRVNDAPVLAPTQPMTLTAIDEDDTTSIGNLVANIIARGGEDPITDVDGDSLEGIAVIGVDDSNGRWQYRLNGTTDWVDFTAVSSISATLLSPDERIRFLPDPNYAGTATFSFRAWDRSDNSPIGATSINTNINGGTTAFSSAQASATITIIGQNDPPILDLNGDDIPGREFTADFDEGLGPIRIVSPTLTLQDVDSNNITKAEISITNLLDGNQELLSATSSSGILINYNPATGTLMLSGSKRKEDYQAILRTITYNNSSLAPTDTQHRFIVFTATDASGASSEPVTSTIRINPVNNVPVVNSFGITSTEDSPITLSLGIFAPHFADPDGDELTEIKVETTPEQGELLLNNIPVTAGQIIPADQLPLFTYQPPANWFGTTTFDWNGKDEEVYPATGGTVSLMITPQNDAPVVHDVEKVGPEDVELTFAAVDFVTQFNDIDGDSLANIRIKSLPGRGTLWLGSVEVDIDTVIAVDALNQLVYAPEEDWNGIISFDWEASDGVLYSTSIASVVLSITAVNDPPTLSPVEKFGSEDNLLPFALSDFAVRFMDVEGNALQKITITSLPSDGQLLFAGEPLLADTEIDADDIDQLTFSPTPDWHGQTSFGWNGQDGTVYADATSFVNLTITPVNDPPRLDLNGSQPGIDYNAAFAASSGTISIVSRDLSLEDIDSEQIVSAVIVLEDRHDGNVEILAADATGTAVTIVYNPNTGTLQLAGQDSIANYQKVLRTLTYRNDSNNPTINNRTVTFRISDGENESTPAQTQITPPRATYLPITGKDATRSDEPNNNCSQAFPLTINRAYQFLPNDQEDWYRFNQTSSSNVTVSLTNFAPQGDGQLIVYSGACPSGLVSLGQNGDHSTTKTITLNNLPAGTYYVRVFSSRTSTTTPYTLQIQK